MSNLLVITGVSGAGKSTAVKVFEELGYSITDNMPLPLIERFMEMLSDPELAEAKTALVIDIRSGDTKKASKIIDTLKTQHKAKIIFLTANEETLIRRYKESRRSHPLGKELTVAIAKEKEQLDDIKSLADIVIDTSQLNVHEFYKELAEIFTEQNGHQILVCLKSFGFKHGLPSDSDIVIDVRFLCNPYFVESMKNKTGLDADVQEYVEQDPAYTEFFTKLKDLVSFLIPQYVKEGKKYLVVSVGCTGGHHRSVTVVEKLAQELKKCDLAVNIRHKDIEK